MVIYPAAGVFLLIWFYAMLRNADNGVRLVIAALPFGMFAAIGLGGLSLIAANLLAMLTVIALCLRFFSWQGLRAPITIPAAGVYLLLFALYSLFSAIVLVRIFQGQFLVFPMTVSTKFTQVSAYFPSTMWPVRPTNSNISQSFYILLSAGFFLAAVLVMRRRGTRFAETGLVWAAAINLILGILDFLKLDTLLSVIRTADYTLANQQTMSGFDRVIGGFSEPAGFGIFSAALSAYFLMSFLIGRRTRDALLATGSIICAVLALSTTGMATLGATVLIVLLHARTFLNRTISRTVGHVFVICTALFAMLASLVFMLTPLADYLPNLLDQLFLSKGESLSGMERGAWAQASFSAFLETWGLGAGVGSLRGNGLFSVLLGSVGIPGTLAFLAFVYQAIANPPRFENPDDYRIFYASRVCVLSILASLTISATVPDPTLLLMTIAALAVASRERADVHRYDVNLVPVRRSGLQS